MPPYGKDRRQDEQVVAAPAIGAVEPLGRVDHLLGVDQLGRRPRPIIAGSVQTPVRGPSGWKAMSPTAIAIR